MLAVYVRCSRNHCGKPLPGLIRTVSFGMFWCSGVLRLAAYALLLLSRSWQQPSGRVDAKDQKYCFNWTPE